MTHSRYGEAVYGGIAIPVDHPDHGATVQHIMGRLAAGAVRAPILTATEKRAQTVQLFGEGLASEIDRMTADHAARRDHGFRPTQSNRRAA